MFINMSSKQSLAKGLFYMHTSGAVYKILSVANTNLTRQDWSLPPCIAYEDVETGVEYARPLSEWTEDKYVFLPTYSSN